MKFTTHTNSVLQKNQSNKNYNCKYELHFFPSLVHSSQKGDYILYTVVGQQLDIVIFNISGTAIKLETCNAIQEEPAALL